MMYVIKISPDPNHWIFFGTYEAACAARISWDPMPKLNLVKP
jgi:hypothetical protein